VLRPHHLLAPALLALAAALPPVQTAGAAAPAATAPSPPLAHKRPAGHETRPTRAQISAAVQSAERSPDLWATINVCNTTQHPDYIGIRGQIPALGFTTHISMTVRVEYYDPARGRFEPTTAIKSVDLGRATRGAHQGGVQFPFQAPAAGESYELRGAITFQWAIGRRVLARAIRHTKHGYQDVDFADPPGYSAGTCTISGPPAGT
jgi:hypothetical protein